MCVFRMTRKRKNFGPGRKKKKPKLTHEHVDPEAPSYEYKNYMQLNELPVPSNSEMAMKLDVVHYLFRDRGAAPPKSLNDWAINVVLIRPEFEPVNSISCGRKYIMNLKCSPLVIYSKKIISNVAEFLLLGNCDVCELEKVVSQLS